MQYRSTNSKNIINILSKLAIVPIIALIILLSIKFKIVINMRTLSNFSVIFTSIILEALPFIFIGSLISSLIQLFVSEETLAKILPKNKLLALMAASVVGVFLPICECAIIPIAKRLIKKGVPVGVATTFMLATPIINPVVILSTYYAFSNNIQFLFLRISGGIVAAIIIGFIVSILDKNKDEVLKSTDYDFDDDLCLCGTSHNYSEKKSKISTLLDTVGSEFLDVSKYVILGAVLSAIFQVLVSRDSLNYLGNNSLLSVVAMMSLAFLLSICSEADAFIASTFVGQFTNGSIIAFLIFGPMLDIKNTLMLIGAFKKRYILLLLVSICVICYLIGSSINIIEIVRFFK